jgi:hypothetical protein
MKNYRQSGLSGNVELGKGGPKVRNNSNVIELRNNADTAMAVGRGADPVGSSDFVTLGYLLTSQAITVIGNIYDSGGATPASAQFVGAGQAGFIAICNQTVGAFTANRLYRLDTWDTDVATSTWTQIIPTEGMRFVMTDASSGGTTAYLADHFYVYDLDNTQWDDIGPAAAAAAVSKNLQAALAFGTASPLAIGTPSVANSVITQVIVNVTTAFDGAAALLDIGTAGDTDAYMDQIEIDLRTIGTYIVDLYALDAGPTAIIGTYAADGSTVGAAAIVVKYETP